MLYVNIWTILKVADNWYGGFKDRPVWGVIWNILLYILATILIICLVVTIVTWLTFWIIELYKRITKSDEKFYKNTMKKRYDTIKCLEEYGLIITEKLQFNKDYTWDFSKDMKFFWKNREIFFTRANNHSLSSIRIYPLDSYESQRFHNILNKHFKKDDRFFLCGEWVLITHSHKNSCYLILLQDDWHLKKLEDLWFKR